jgi:site-specific recombinase XerD
MPPEQPPLFDLPAAAPRAAPPGRGPALDPATPLAPAIQGWLDHLAKIDTSRHTVIAFRSDLNLLLEYLEPTTPLNTVGTAVLNQFLAWMKDERGKPCSDKTYGRRVTSLKAFFRWVTPLAELRADPAETLIQLNVRSPLPEALTAEEIERCQAAGERLRRAEEKPDIRPLILFDLLLQTGMKKVEVANLKLEHVDASNAARPHLYVRYPEKKDWPKERKLDLTPGWIELYRDYRAEFNPKEVVFPWSVRKLEYALGDTGRAAGLEKNVSFDMMRWTCALRDHQAGMEEEALRRKLGLSPIQWRETGDRIRKLSEGE